MAERGDVYCMIIWWYLLLWCCPSHTLQASHTTSPSVHNSSCHPYPGHIIKEMLKREDYDYDVKLLPSDHKVSTFLEFNQTQRLVFPLAVGGPITITVTPCDFPLSWRLTLRSYHVQAQEKVKTQQYLGVVKKEISGTVSAVGGSSASNNNRVTNVSYNYSKLGGHSGREESSPFRVWQQVVTRPPGTSALLGRAQEGYMRSEAEAQQETMQERYKGHEPHQFRRREAAAGLYVLQLHADMGATYVHIHVACLWTPPPSTNRITATPSSHGLAVTLSWADRRSGDGYCLAMSEERPFPSLCAARAALAPAHRGNKWPRAILGCTNNPWYQLPNAPRRPLHVTVWEAGHAGPPLSRGLVPAKPKTKIPRLKPGALMSLVPSAAGTAVAKFRMPRRGRRLHVIAVACGAKLRLRVMAPRGERLASAVGNLGALHLVVKKRKIPTRILFLRLSTKPTGSASKVILTASYTARALSLPRLPRNARVRPKAVTCTSVTLKWSASQGLHSYCLLVKEDKSGEVWRTRPPRQCGWEAALTQTTNFSARWCSPPTPAGRQKKTLHTLVPATTYIATVLSRHSTTGHALSFTPVRFTTPALCPDTTTTNNTTTTTTY